MTRPVRVCVDLTPGEMRDRFGGFWRYGVALAGALAGLPPRDDLDIVVLVASDRPPIPLHEALERRDLPAAPVIAPRRHRLQRFWLSGRLLTAAGVDLFHSLTPAALPAGSRGTTLATAYDLIPLLYPDPAHTWRARLERLDDRVRQPWRYRRPHHLLAISEATRRDLVSRLKVPGERITVVPLGVDAAAFSAHGPHDEADTLRARWRLPERFFLAVGSDHHRKNQWRLFEEWQAVSRQIPEGLVLVGKALYGGVLDGIAETARTGGFGDRVRWLPDVPDEALPAFYRQATALVAPSLYEGFGLTLLEAMACWTPVAASRILAHVEVAADAAEYFDPSASGELSSVLTRLSGDPGLRLRLSSAGPERVARFSWAATARQTRALYARLLRLSPE
jgi:glycosyltransferase involved in cell wall biosynthesis